MSRLSSLLALLVLPTSAGAFQLRWTSSGIPVRWAPGTHMFYADESLDELTGGPGQSRVILEEALAAWAATPGVELDWLAGSSQDAIAGYDTGSPNGPRNEVIAVPALPGHPDALAVTVVTYDDATGFAVDADILIRSRHVDFSIDGDPEAHDLRSVLTHEVGHALGLEHEEEDPEATMFPETPRGETSKRTPSEDDQAGLVVLYSPDIEAYRTMGCSTTALGSRSEWSGLLGIGGLFAVVICRRRSWGSSQGT